VAVEIGVLAVMNTAARKHRSFAKLIAGLGLIALLALVHWRFAAAGQMAVLRFDIFEVILIFVQLFAILDPVAVIPTFLALTSDISRLERAAMVRTVATTVLAMMIIFALLGQAILDALKVSIDSFRFGGGILLMVLAIDSLAGFKRTKSVEKEDVIMVPITTPLLVGPGTMTILIVLTATKSLLEVLTGCVLVSLVTYLLLRFSSEIMNALGPNAIRAMGRLTSVIIAAFAAEMIHASLVAWGIAS